MCAPDRWSVSHSTGEKKSQKDCIAGTHAVIGQELSVREIDRKIERERSERKRVFELLCYNIPVSVSLPLSLSFSVINCPTFTSLSSLRFPQLFLSAVFHPHLFLSSSHCLFHTKTSTLSLSVCRDACRTQRWFTCSPAIISEVCVCVWLGACVRRGSVKGKQQLFI